MPEQEYQFDRDSAQRIARVVRRVEASLRPDGIGVVTTGPQGGQRVSLVKVTSTTANADGYYPGVQYVATQAAIQDPAPPLTVGNAPPGVTTPTANQYSNLTQDCWVRFNSGSSPQAGNVYPAVASAAYTDGLPIYFAGDPTGSFSGAATAVNGATIPANMGEDLTLSNYPQYDTDGYIASPNTTFIAPEDGYYQAVFTIFWSGVPPHTSLELSINSSGYNETWTPGITTSPYVQGTFTGHLTAGQAVQAHVFATNACSVNTGFATVTKLSGSGGGSDTPPVGVASINSQTGSIVLEGGGDAGGVGVEIGTVGNQITTGLSEAALAAARLFLAQGNI